MPIFQTITDLSAGEAIVQRRPYGVIELRDDRFVGVHLRPWPTVVMPWEYLWFGERRHRHSAGNRCLLYYNQPLGSRNFLSLKYILSYRDTTFRTFHGALQVLDEIARIKQTDAIVCHVANGRISDRLLDRWGWQRHVPGSNLRHFIKRFYGNYADASIAGGKRG